jgi:hypothetical protein
MYLSKEKELSLKQENLAHCFPVRLKLVFKGVLSTNDSFKDGERLILLQIGLFS